MRSHTSEGILNIPKLVADHNTYPDHCYSGNAVRLLDDSTVGGVNDAHEWMVFEVVGPELLSALKWKLPVKCIKSVVERMLQGLHYTYIHCF